MKFMKAETVTHQKITTFSCNYENLHRNRTEARESPGKSTFPELPGDGLAFECGKLTKIDIDF